MAIPHPGISEIGWLADLKEIAEGIGSDVYDEQVCWDVEVLTAATKLRPDVVIRRGSTGEALACGEAKRPDSPKGIHPLVASEVSNALEKAEILGVPVCFTTNFFHLAVFDSRKSPYPTNLDRLQGGLIPLLPEGLAKSIDWWAALSQEERRLHLSVGLHQFFERLKLSTVSPLQREIDEVALLVFSRTTERLVSPLFEVMIAERQSPNGLSTQLIQHALRVHLQPQKDSDARYLVAQGVAEVLTATLFYRNIAEHFSLDSLLGGTNPRTASGLYNRLCKSFRNAVTRSGDYETIFSLSAAAEWVLLNGGKPILQHWKDLFGFIEQLDFTSVSSDIIGSIFERLISPERRHDMGQHYTQPRVARAMSQWAVRSKSDHIADLACGAGTFLVEIYNCLATYGGSHQAICAQTIGNDIDPFAVHLAAVNLATRDIYKGANYPAVSLGDAFDIQRNTPVISINPVQGDPISILWPADGLDAVVGNPPYAESPDDVGALQAKLLALGLKPPSGMAGGNLAAWFMLLAAALIKENGHCALVMPTAVLQNDNLRSWRTWLRGHFDMVVWHTEDDVWFSDARIATCVILTSPKQTKKPGLGSLIFVDVRERINGELTSLSGIPTPSSKASVRDLSTLSPEADILIAGTYPEPLERLRKSEKIYQLNDIPCVTVYSGNKLGHDCFQLRDCYPKKAGVIREVEGFKMRLRLNIKYLTPMFASPKEERTGEFTESGTWVLTAPEVLPSTGALKAYIRHCETLGIHEAPSVRARGRSWWSVKWKSSQIAVQIHPGFLHQIWWSEEPYIAKNNFHILKFEKSAPQSNRELIAASLASGFGALSALYISSEVGCEGVRWLSSQQFEQWPVLNPSLVDEDDWREIIKAYRSFRKLEVAEIPTMDAALLDQWHILTTAIAKAAGLKGPNEIASEVIDYARHTCVRRVQREALALAGRTRSSGSGKGAFTKLIRTCLEKHPLITSVLEGLTGGDKVLRLRTKEELAQVTLDLGDSDSEPLLGEEALTEVLGSKFECAPITTPSNSDTLAKNVRKLLDELIKEILGSPPRKEDSASRTYSENMMVVRSTAIDWMQKEVRERLN